MDKTWLFEIHSLKIFIIQGEAYGGSNYRRNHSERGDLILSLVIDSKLINSAISQRLLLKSDPKD